MQHFLVCVDRADWEACRAGDDAARLRLKVATHGLQLYDHGFNPGPGSWVCVTLAELEDARVVESVVIDNSFFCSSPLHK
jgi:hypothetical protein